MNKIMYLNISKKEEMSLYVHVLSHPEPGDTYTCFLSYSTQEMSPSPADSMNKSRSDREL